MTLLHEDGKRNRERPEIEIVTFGFFTVKVNEKPVLFHRSRSKEILAYLVQLQGQSVRRATIADKILNEPRYDRKVQERLNVYICELKRQLKEEGIDHILICQKGEYAVDTTVFRCDLYDYLRDYSFPVTENPGLYLQEYEWAREKAAFLYRKFWRNF